MIKADQQKFTEEYKTIHESFARYCNSICYGIMEPDDLMSDSVVIVLEKYSEMKDNIQLLPYLIGIANNIIRRKIRRRKVVSFFGLDNAKTQHSSNRSDLSAEIRDLYEALHQLPLQDKECIVLFELSGFAVRDIAQITHSTEAAVKTRLHRSRKKLKELLEDPPTSKVTYSVTSKMGGAR